MDRLYIGPYRIHLRLIFERTGAQCVRVLLLQSGRRPLLVYYCLQLYCTRIAMQVIRACSSDSPLSMAAFTLRSRLICYPDTVPALSQPTPSPCGAARTLWRLHSSPLGRRCKRQGARTPPVTGNCRQRQGDLRRSSFVERNKHAPVALNA
jgi:hypothetical protein